MLFVLSQHELLCLLFATGLVAGTVDAIAGGGGLISLPVLLGVGMPTHIALGTNKLQSTIGTLVATWSYHRHGLISPHSLLKKVFFIFLGATAGAISAQILPGNMLKKIIPLLLLIILIYAVFCPKFGDIDNKPKMHDALFYPVFGSLLGFYDGFLGPGTGSFWVFAIIFFLGYNVTKATAYTKVFNLTSNVVALFCFILGNNIDYRLGLYMAAGQLIGGRLGAHFAMRNGARIIRPLFLMIVGMTICMLVYKNYIAPP